MKQKKKRSKLMMLKMMLDICAQKEGSTKTNMITKMGTSFGTATPCFKIMVKREMIAAKKEDLSGHFFITQYGREILRLINEILKTLGETD